MRKEVKKEMKKNNSSNISPLLKVPTTFGEKSADAITKWAGSWTFIISFFGILGLWMFTNGYFFLRYLKEGMIDPFPFILLNLILSCIAAIQGPIILMSQNRQTQRDRIKANYDYAINRKAEREVKEIKELLEKHLIKDVKFLKK